MRRRGVLAATSLASVLAGMLAGCSSGANAARTGASGPSAGGEGAVGTAPTTQRLVAAAALAPCPRSQSRPGVPPAGSGLPALTLACLGTGPAVGLPLLRGPALVNLWASWCRPCRVEMPQLQALHARAAGRLLVLGVVTDDNRRNALSAAAGLGVHYPSVLDTGGTLRRSYGYPGPPVTLLVDRRGAVVHRIFGTLPAPAALAPALARHLQVRL